MGYISVDGAERKLILRSNDGSVDCKCRFKHIVHEIPFTYKNLVQALNDAIDKEASETGNQFITNERATSAPIVEYDYDSLMSEFSTIVGELMTRDSAKYGPKITQIVDKYLGRGKKVSDATPDQAEFISLIVIEIKEELL